MKWIFLLASDACYLTHDLWLYGEGSEALSVRLGVYPGASFPCLGSGIAPLHVWDVCLRERERGRETAQGFEHCCGELSHELCCSSFTGKGQEIGLKSPKIS